MDNQNIYFIRYFIAGCYFGYVWEKPQLMHEIRFILNAYKDPDHIPEEHGRSKQKSYIFPLISYNINFGLGKK